MSIPPRSKLSINLERDDELVEVLPVREDDEYVALFGSDKAMMVSLSEEYQSTKELVEV